MPKYTGTHGTSLNNKDDILSNGFRLDLTRYGLRGRGIYFWAEGPYSYELAKGWFLFHRDIHSFESDEIGVVLKAELEAAEDEVVEHSQIQDSIMKCSEKAKKKTGKLSKELKCSIYNTVIKQVEEKYNKTIKIYIADLAPPMSSGRFNFYDLEMFGAPKVLIARTSNCIRDITEIGEFL